MAAGDKKPVVMEADLAKPGGPATLNENGKLSESQRPSLKDLGGANRTLSNITDPAAARANLGAADQVLSNLSDPAAALVNLGAKAGENLLDNGYFADPINQRDGYIVPPGTPYYSDMELTAQAGTVSAYTTSVNVNSTYGMMITIDDTEYYVPWSACVRGYTGVGHGIDRWRCWETNTTTIEDGYVTITRQIGQVIENGLDILSGKTVTISALLADGTLMTNSGVITPKENSVLLVSIVGEKVNLMLYLDTTTMSFQFNTLGSDPVSIVAAKLELGPVQTLAHQDADGSWVLNDPPPSKALELAKCQRYFFRAKPYYDIGQPFSNIAAFRYRFPVEMRAAPAAALQKENDLTDAVTNGSVSVTPTSYNVVFWNTQGMSLNFTIPDEAIATWYACQRYVDFSADL